MKTGETILGLDLGTTSCGWALIEHEAGDIDIATGEVRREGVGTILGMGVRIFPETLEERSLEPLNKQRRLARLMRRQTKRRAQRRKRMTAMLVGAGLLPAYGSAAWTALMTATDPYELRARAAAGEALTAHEVGRALYHLEKRRGFKDRAPVEMETDRADPEADKESGAVKAGIAALDAAKGDRTLGAHLAAERAGASDKDPDPPRTRGRWLGRRMVEEEFDRVVAAQKGAHPVLADKDFAAGLRDLVFFQRPTFWRETTLGKCDLVPEAPLALKADWTAQRSVVLQTVNALRLDYGNKRPLTEAEREVVLDLCDRDRKVTFGKIRTALKPLWKENDTPTRSTFTHEKDKRKDIPGNATEAALRDAFGDAWDTHPARDRLRAELPQMLWDVNYRATGQRPKRKFEIRDPGERSTARAELAARLTAEFGIDAAHAAALSDLTLPSGWSRHSGEALAAINPHLEAGLTYAEARLTAFPDALAREGGRDRLSAHPKALPDTRNPAVTRALNELRKVVNNLLDEYGKPDRIRLEVARDLKLSPSKRLEVVREIKKNERARKNAAEGLEKNGIEPTRRNVEKWLLWQESDNRCPYTGVEIGFDDLFKETKVDIEHIVPRSRSNDNRMANKTICVVGANRAKGNRNPHEAFQTPAMLQASGRDWDGFVDLVWNLKNMPAAKKKRLTEARDGPVRTRDGLTVFDPLTGTLLAVGAERQLRDTSFISRAAKDFLLTLYRQVEGRADPVEPVSSKVSVELRYRWGLHNILVEGDADGAEGGQGDGPKNRDDHRHHAVDALVVALSTVRHTQLMSRWLAEDKLGRRPAFPLPWPSLRADAEAALDRIVVSHRVRRKVSGRLHEETVLGDTGRRETSGKGKGAKEEIVFVKRKPVEALTDGEIPAIRDLGIRRAVEAAIAEHGSLKKAAEAGIFLPHNDEKRPIKRVRIELRRQESAVMPLNAETKAWAELGPGSLHHIAFYKRPDGKIGYATVLKREAALRRRRGAAAVDKTDAEGNPLLCSLCPGDMLEKTHPDGRKEYWMVRKFNQAGQVFHKPHTEVGQPKPEKSLSGSWFLDGTLRKVTVDPIGRVRPARD
jgi:CRISPR-associated endonuclease Csn1